MNDSIKKIILGETDVGLMASFICYDLDPKVSLVLTQLSDEHWIKFAPL